EGDNFELEPFDPAGADVVWLCNPNNPTGRWWPGTVVSMSNWIRAHPQTLFVVDEAYLRLSYPWMGDKGSLIHCSTRLGNLVVLRSFTKYYALPGLRLGYLVGNPRINAIGMRHVREQIPCWSINRLAQIAGLAALGDCNFDADTQVWLLT